MTCMKCEQVGTTAVYWGETARTGYERGQEHIAGMESRYEKNALWKHSYLYHEGKLGAGEIKMEIIEGHRSPLNRQIHEGVELYTNAASIIMNSKSEWGNSKIPRIVIEMGEEIEEDDRNGMCRST